MKTQLATFLSLAIVVVANPASAYVVAITTSIPATSVADDTDLETALSSAIDDVLRNAIAFSATFVTVLKAWVVEDRVYVLLLIGDREGEEMMKKLSGEGTTDIKLPDHEEAISPVTILDGQGRVVRVVPAQEFRRQCASGEGHPPSATIGRPGTGAYATHTKRGVQNPRNEEDRHASFGDRPGRGRESCRGTGGAGRGAGQQA